MIHIFAGEKVCIQAISPMQSGSAFAAMIIRWMAPESVSTGCHCHRHRQRAGVVQLVDDGAGLLLHLDEGLRTVQALAAGQEPARAGRWS